MSSSDSILENPLYFKGRLAWRHWLEKNHSKKKQVWLLCRKKHSSKQGLTYAEALEEALCFGWIDATMKSVDSDFFKQMFSQRNPKSSWSLMNKERALKLIAEGKMAEPGMAKINAAKKSGKWDSAYSLKKDLALPSDLSKSLKKSKIAWKNFMNFSKGQKNMYILWAIEAKTIETRKKRIAKIVKRASENKKPRIN